MICRLCLITITVENRVSIFTAIESDGESQIVKLIAKFFHLEVTQHDAISTTLCQECWNHIDEFNKFCILVDEKQSSLRNEFLEVKCDFLLHPNEVNIEQNESLFDIKDVLEEAIEVQLKCEQNEINIFEEVEPSQANKDEEISDDDIPLQELIRKHSNKKKLKEVTHLKTAKELKPANIVKLATKIKQPKKEKQLHIIKKLHSKSAFVKVADGHKTGYKKYGFEFENKEDNDYESGNTKDDEYESGNTKDDDYEHELDIRTFSDTQASEVNEDELPSTSTIRKRKKQFTKKPSLAEAEDMDIYISQNMQLKCDLCDEHFEKFCDVRPHFKNQHKCREYIKCCGRRHNKRMDLFEHIKWHFDPEYFKCDTCGKLMKNRYCLAVHKMTKHLKKEDLAYNCEYCDKRFARPSLLNNHVKTTHEAKRIFACQLCDKSFYLKHALAKHIRSIHDNIFPHICDVCGMKFKFKPSFETHVLEHQGIIAPPVKCPECGEWVKNKNRLRLHLTTHNKVDVHCQYCGRVCASLSAMRAHIQYMHRRPPSYKCSFCGKFFKTPKILKEHVATHTGENLYNCPHCIKEFRSSANMYVHIKRQHTQEWLAAQVVRTKTPPNVENS